MKKRKEKRKRQLILNKNFYFLLVAQLSSNLGNWAYYVALSLYIYDLFGNNTSLGFLAITYTLPVVLLAPIAGVLADKFDRKKIMIVSDILRAIILFILPFTENLILIYLLVTLEHSFAVIFNPANKALLPLIITEKTELIKANSIYTTVRTIAKMSGGFFGAFLIVRLGVKSAFFLDALTFLFSATMVLLINVRVEKNQGDNVFGKLKIWNNFMDGIKVLKNETLVRKQIINFSLAMLNGAMISSFLVVFIQENLGLEEAYYGTFISIMTAGIVLGSFLTPYINKSVQIKKMNYSFLLTFFIYSTILVLLVQLPYLTVSFVFIFLFGISEVILTITNQTVIQIGIDNQYQGRVFSVSEAGWNCSLLIGSVIGGLLNDWLSLTFTFTTLGAILALYSIYQLFTFLKTSKNVNNNVQKTNIDS